MFFTYRGSQLQPYKSWKNTENIAINNIPSWSKENTINDNYHSAGFTRTTGNCDESVSTSISYSSGIWDKPRPIKHWRKRLLPNQSSKSKTGTGIPMDKPGSVSTNTLANSDLSCDNNENRLVEYVNHNKIYNSGQLIDVSDNFIYGKCISCDPQSNMIKPASTKLNKNYYSSSKAYLYAKCKTFDQRNGGPLIDSIKYFDDNKQPIYPSDSNDGTQMRYANGCGEKCKIVYKPNNQAFAVQGAVSSSTRIVALKNNTITNNNFSFSTAFTQSNIAMKKNISHGCKSFYYKNGIKHLCR